MLDFSVFDSILDAAFVVDGEGRIQYTNDAGAAFCQLSIRRLIGKALLSDVMTLAEPNVLPFNENSLGRKEPTPFIETGFQLLKASHQGKAQLTVRPVDEKHWVFFFRDVSLEEALHSKYRTELAQKEDYARNLEKLVEARTAELRSVNQTLNAILDSLGQGFFTFDSRGECGPVYTKACQTVLEGIPAHRKAWEVLGVPASERDQFCQWVEALFHESLTFEDLRELGPSTYPHSQRHRIVLDYHPIRQEQNKITNIVVVATDKTAEYKAQQALEAERRFASMVVKFTKNKDQFMQFLVSVRESFAGLSKLAKGPFTDSDVRESFRVLHTLEGEAGIFSIAVLRDQARLCQQALEPLRCEPAEGREREQDEASRSETVRRYQDLLIDLERSFDGFLETNKDLFSNGRGGMERTVEVPLRSLEAFLAELKKKAVPATLVTQFGDIFMRVSLNGRMQAFDGVVQSVAERLGKKVKPLVVEGDSVSIFPEPYLGVLANLVHAFRNAVDHGLEDPEEREWAGKDPAGRLSVNIGEGPWGIRIVVSDDGRGIDPNLVREKLKEKFPGRDFSKESDSEVIQNVFLPGFSSRDSVGEFSGRGVGLDALREEVLKLNGRIHLQSKVGSGTQIEIVIPQIKPDGEWLRSA